MVGEEFDSQLQRMIHDKKTLNEIDGIASRKMKRIIYPVRILASHQDSYSVEGMAMVPDKTSLGTLRDPASSMST